MKLHLIQKYFDTKSKADHALSQLGVIPPKTGGVPKRHELLMEFSLKQLKTIAYV